MNMEEKLRSVVLKATIDSDLWHAIVHGNDTTVVETDNGDVPTVAKQLKDIRDSITGGVSDVVADAEAARDASILAKEETQSLQQGFENLKSETQELRNETETFKNISQTTFNNIAQATSSAVLSVQNEGNTQILQVQGAVEEQIQIAAQFAQDAKNATDNKLDKNFANMQPTSDFIMQIISWLCPDWTRKKTLALNVDVTIIQKGWILMRNTDYTTRVEGFINTHRVLQQAGTYGRWEDWNSISFLVDVGDVVKLTGGELLFIPCKGVL